MVALVLSFGAGVLSVLSPCVVPLLPIVVASALQAHARGPLVLAAGLAISSATMGVFFAAFTFTTGIDRDAARGVAAMLMAVAGIVLLVPRLQDVFGRVTTPLATAAGALTTRL